MNSPLRCGIYALLMTCRLGSFSAAEPSPLTFKVNAERDTGDHSPGDGLCLDRQGGCSLRAAIEESNAAGQPVRILLPAGRFTLGVSGAGSLSVEGTVSLSGDGMSHTSISGGGAIRLFRVARAATLELSSVTLREGSADDEGGGAILVERGGVLFLRSVLLTENQSKASGGALLIAGKLSADGLAVTDCRASLDGGAIRAALDSQVEIRNATLARNRAGREGGGLATAGSMTLNNLTLVDNSADLRGGGIAGVGRIRIANSILARNLAPAAPDCGDGPVSLGHNLLGDPAGCAWTLADGDLFSMDPGLGPLRAHADDTLAFGLRNDSPAISAGHPAPPGSAEPGACAAADQRGVVRTRCSIGAYEPRSVALRLAFLQPNARMFLSRGRPSIVTVQVENHGDSPATSVRLRIERAEGLRVEETVPAGCRGTDGCLLGDLNPGDIRRIDIPVGILLAGGPALLMVSASAEEPEDRPGSARSEFSTQVDVDRDGDGVSDAVDCRPQNPAVWTASTESRALTVADGAVPTLAWQPPVATGTAQPVWYDVLRATSASGFGSATCVASGITATGFSDAPPASAYYLVRAHNLCGGVLGYDSSGTPTAGAVCAGQTGQLCLADGSCAGGFCRDGLCCVSNCTGICETCGDPAAQGQCLAISAGTDPDNECTAQPASSCGPNGNCSGSRSCALHASSTVCVAAVCQNATTSSLSDLCNGSGTCLDGGTQNCVPYVCSGATGLCRTSCTGNSDCASGHTCNTAAGVCE